MKMSLLDIVQDILNDLDSDEVNSIDDTTESQQIAQIVKSTYFAMMSNRNWPHLKRGISLQAPGTTATPTHMTLSDSVKELSFINYNKSKVGRHVRSTKLCGGLSLMISCGYLTNGTVMKLTLTSSQTPLALSCLSAMTNHQPTTPHSMTL